MRRLYPLFLLVVIISCSPDPEKPEQQARTLQPYPVHTLPLGIRLDSLQKVLHGHSALFDPKVENRLFRIIPLNAYDNQGYGAVELFPDSTIRTYYWYTNIEALTPDQQKYYTAPRPAADIKPVLSALTAQYGPPTKMKPYPDEEWYTWRNDSTSINLTLQNKSVTLTKTGPSAPIVIDTTTPKPEPKVAGKPKTAIKKAIPKKVSAGKKAVAKKAVTKKPVLKKSAAKRPTTRRR